MRLLSFLFPSRVARRRLLVATLLAGAAGTASACPPSPGATCELSGSAPASQPLGVGVNLGAGNPINVINGNKYQREEDMPALPGVMGLEIVRHYNSALSGRGDWTGRVGRGWRLSYETRLVASSRAIEIQQADGARLLFSRDALQPTVATPDDAAHGAISTKRGAQGEEYVWRWADGRELSFNHQGQLMQIKAATGEITSLMYDPKGPLVRVTDPQGRSMSLTYLDRQSAARGDRFRGVQRIQTPVGRFSYEYGSAAPKGLKLDQRYLLANLVRVRYPLEGQGRQYHYEDAVHPTFMTGISIEGADAAGKPTLSRYATFGYNAAGKGILSTHANDVDKVTLDFEKNGVTTITNSLGQKTTYRYAGAESNYRLVEVRGAGCSLCGPANQRYRYDQRGRLVETIRLDSLGMPLDSSLTEFDPLGRTMRVSRVAYRGGKAGKPEMEVRYEYTGNGGPRLIARPSVVPGREWVTEIIYGGPAGRQPVRVTESGHIPTFDGKDSAGTIERSVGYRYNRFGQRTETDGPMPNGAKDAGPANSDISRVQYAPKSHLPSRTVMPGNMVTAVSQRDEALRPIRLRSTDGYRAQTTSTRYNWRSQPTEIVIEAALLDRAGAAIAGSKLTRVLRYSYDAAGRLAGVTTPDKLTTRFVYDDAGRLVHKILPDGSRVSTERDTEGKLLVQARYADAAAAAAPLGRNRFGYDSEGRLKQSEDGVGLVGTVRYTSAGQVAEQSNALGTSTRFDYDDNGLLRARIDGAGSTDAASTNLVRDSHGQLTELTDANGVTTTRRYDDFGRKVAEVNPDRGTVLFRHDPAGHAIARIDDIGVVTSYSYDAAGRLSAVGDQHRQPLVRYRYEGRHLAEITSSVPGDATQVSERTVYAHDGFGQVVRTSRWLARADDAGRDRAAPTSAASAPQRQGLTFVTESRYDEMGRVIQRRLPDGHTMGYRYAAETQGGLRAGQLSALLFDERIVVTDIEQTLAGGLTSYTMHNGVRQRIISDGRGRVTELLAQAQPVRPGEGPAQRWWRHLSGLLGDDDRPALIYAQSNRYDLADRVESIVRQQNGATMTKRSEKFSYDRLDRLTGMVVEGSAPQTWRYDQGGNRIAEKNGDGELEYSYQRGSNRLVGQASSSPQLANAAWFYHASGVPLAWLSAPGPSATRLAPGAKEARTTTGRRVAYNDARRPIVVYGDDGRVVARYAYNALGERIAKTVYPASSGQGQTRYSLYQDQRLVAETDGDGRITAHYVYLNDKPVAKVEMAYTSSTARPTYAVMRKLAIALRSGNADADGDVAGIYAIHTDHLGTPQSVTDDDAKVVWQATTTPFGLAVVSHAAVHDGRVFEMNLRLPGQIYDAETGLNLNYLRDYDPQLGRYTSTDPLGLAGGTNPYAYVDSNPLTKIDPLGLYEHDIHYYTTYFLARVAGVDARMAYLIATGAQYIDDNPITQPMADSLLDSAWGVIAHNAEAQNRLARYHFTQKESDDVTQDMTTRYKNPNNEQLRRLAAASMQAESLGSECAKAVMYGEYLHAFEDTFAHRTYDNEPIGINMGLGHLIRGHFPDHTYNENALLGHNWTQNESRTLEMQEEMYNLLKGTWGNKATVHSFSEVRDLLENFNKTKENAQNTSSFDSTVIDHRAKVEMLNDQLNTWEYKFVSETGVASELDLMTASRGRYDANVGAENRKNFYRYKANLNGYKAGDAFNGNDSSFDGVILE